MKAFGFEVPAASANWAPDVAGLCMKPDGTILGHWISSNVQFLKADLKKHADKAGLEYEFLDSVPDWAKASIKGQDAANLESVLGREEKWKPS
jgi:hypothetical protein